MRPRESPSTTSSGISLPRTPNCRAFGDRVEAPHQPQPCSTCRLNLSSLWELILADVAEAELIEAAVGSLMYLAHHVVSTALKCVEDSCRFDNRQFERPFQIKSAGAVGKRNKSIKARRRSCGWIEKTHSD